MFPKGRNHQCGGTCNFCMNNRGYGGKSKGPGKSKNAGRVLSRDSLRCGIHDCSSTEIHYGVPYRMSIYELAARRPDGKITFPVTCKFCPQTIFLHARENGAFAVFNELGNGWPLHECPGFQRSSYRTTDQEWPAEFDVPAGDKVRPGNHDELEAGDKFTAVVVNVDDLPSFDEGGAFWEATLSTGSFIYYLWLDRAVQAGDCVIGQIDDGRWGRKLLINVRTETPPRKLLDK